MIDRASASHFTAAGKMTIARVVALVLTLMSAVYGMQAASKDNDVHPRQGWSYFIRAPGKILFRPVASANLIEAWNVCVRAKSVETAIFLDGMGYTYGQQHRSLTCYSIHLSVEDADELLEPLINAVCNQYTKRNWRNFIGLSVLGMSDSQPETVRVSLYSLALGPTLFQNPLVIDTINEALKRDVKDLAIMEHLPGPLINSKHKSVTNFRAWAAYVEELDGSNRSGEFYRVESIHGLKKLGLILSHSAVLVRPFRMVIEQTDRSRRAAYQKLEMEYVPLVAFNLIRLILNAATDIFKVFNIFPSQGIERMIGFTLEPRGENALIALHFAENERIDQEAVIGLVKQMTMVEPLNAAMKAPAGDVQYVFAERWFLLATLNDKPLTKGFMDFPVKLFPQIAHEVVGNVEKAGFGLCFAPSDLKPVPKGAMDFIISIFIPSANIRLLIIRVWADLMKNKQFSPHRHIEKYSIATLKDGGPYEFTVWLRTTKIRLEELKELRMFYAMFLRYIGIKGVTPMVAIIQNNDNKTLRPYLDGPIDLSMFDFDSIKHFEWSNVPAQVSAEAMSDWIAPVRKKAATKNAKKKGKTSRTHQPRVAESENTEISLQLAVEEATTTHSEPTRSVVETLKPTEVKKKPANSLNTKRVGTEVVAPQQKMVAVKEEAFEEEGDFPGVVPIKEDFVEEEDDFPCVVPQEMEGCVHPKDLFKPAEVPSTVDARIASLSAGQYTASALIQTNTSPAPSSPPHGSLYTASKLLWEGFTKGIRPSDSTDPEDHEINGDGVPKIVLTLMDDAEHLVEHDDEISSETSESYDPLGSYDEDHSGEHNDDHSEVVIADEPAAIDFTQTYPLNDEWDMLYIKPPYTIKKLSTVPISTVQVFWQYMNHLPYPAIGHAYAFWRNGGLPETSNAENRGGGRLRTQISLSRKWTKMSGKDHWMHILVWLLANQEHRTIAKISGVIVKERIHGVFHIDVWYRKGFQYNDLQAFKRAMATIGKEQELKFTGEWKIDRFL